MLPITESELRQLVRVALSTEAIKIGAHVCEELGVERGAARVDLALIGAQMEGYELKSDFDSLGRMHNQIHAYNRVFDKITLVTGPVFAAAAEELMPRWWGLMIAQRNEEGIAYLTERRAPTRNTTQDPYSLAMLLWKEEALSVLTAAQVKSSPKASRAQLCDQLVETLPLERLRESVARCLTERLSASVALS